MIHFFSMRNRPSNLSIQDKSINFAIRLKDVIEKERSKS